MDKKEIKYVSGHDLEGRMKLTEAIPLGLQHVLAMFAGNLTPILIISGMCGITAGSELQVTIIQNAMMVAGIVTLIQLFTIGPIGSHLPVVMGTSSGFLGVTKGIAASMGGGIVSYAAILGGQLIGGLFEMILGVFLKPLRKFFPPLVTGTVVLAIGLSLISVGINSFCGGSGVGDYATLDNLFVGIFVMTVILILKHGTKGITSSASILFGIIAGYILVVIMALFLPTTYVNAEGITMTHSWVLQWHKVTEAAWFKLPTLMPLAKELSAQGIPHVLGYVFDIRAIFPLLAMFVVTAVETIGDTSGVTQGGLDREPTDKELRGTVMCDGVGSSIASIFGVLPTTSFSQNVGLVGLTKVVNLFAISIGAIFLVLCGFFPKLAALVSIMPQPVLGGAAVLMFSSIALSGINLITKEKVDARAITIVSVALGLGYGIGSTAGATAHLPQALKYVCGESGIVPACFFAILLNILIPKEKSEK